MSTISASAAELEQETGRAHSPEKAAQLSTDQSSAANDWVVSRDCVPRSSEEVAGRSPMPTAVSTWSCEVSRSDKTLKATRTMMLSESHTVGLEQTDLPLSPLSKTGSEGVGAFSRCAFLYSVEL